MRKTRECFRRPISWKRDKPMRPLQIWDESSTGNKTKAIMRDYTMPYVEPWPIKSLGWGNVESDTFTNSFSEDKPPIPISMERPNHVNPTYVDIRRRLNFWSQQNYTYPESTRSNWVHCPGICRTPGIWCRIIKWAGRRPRNAPTTEPEDEFSQGEEWEMSVQIGYSTTGKSCWNIDGI